MSDKLEERARECGPDLLTFDYDPTSPTAFPKARIDLVKLTVLLTQVQIEARERLAAWMMENGFATGHGDTFEDLLKELTWQVAEIRAAKKLAMEPRLILRCQAVHPEVGQCELRAGHEFEKHLAGMILWAGG